MRQPISGTRNATSSVTATAAGFRKFLSRGCSQCQMGQSASTATAISPIQQQHAHTNPSGEVTATSAASNKSQIPLRCPNPTTATTTSLSRLRGICPCLASPALPCLPAHCTTGAPLSSSSLHAQQPPCTAPAGGAAAVVGLADQLRDPVRTGVGTAHCYHPDWHGRSTFHCPRNIYTHSSSIPAPV